MAILNFTTREFREKQAFVFDKIDAGDEVIIRRGKKNYIITAVEDKDMTISDELRLKIDKAREDIKSGRSTKIKDINNIWESIL